MTQHVCRDFSYSVFRHGLVCKKCGFMPPFYRDYILYDSKPEATTYIFYDPKSEAAT